jgi:hypothetical protein
MNRVHFLMAQQVLTHTVSFLEVIVTPQKVIGAYGMSRGRAGLDTAFNRGHWAPS